MRPLPPDVENPIEVSLIRLMQAQAEPPPLTFPELSGRYVPGRGLFLSTIAHELVIAALVLLSVTLSRGHLPGSRAFSGTIKLSDAKGVVYLPVLGGGGEGNGHKGGSPGLAKKASAPAPSRSSKGRTYPGPQPILSDPENPTNNLQTIIQPALEKPKVLQEFVPLPNMVKIAKPKTPLPTDLVPSTPMLPELHLPPTPAAQVPKLPLPPTPPPAPIRPAAEKKRPAAAKTVEPPKLAESRTEGTEEKALVSLSPTPTLPEANPEMPLGEARGRFAVSPAVNLAPENAPGAKIEGASGAAIGQIAAGIGNAAGDHTEGAGNGNGGTAEGGGGVGTGVGADQGSGKGGTGTQAAHGSGVGAGIGTGSGTTTATGAGAGNGSGKGGLPGLTIQGGTFSRDNGGATNGANTSSREINITLERQLPPTAYGMTITSTADSGGGLPDLGVFVHEKVYTVYLDVKATPNSHSPSWTLQYSRLRLAGEAAGAGANPGGEGLVPPYPLTKEIPKFNSELIRTYLRNVVVVYAVLDTQGRLQRLSVRQSPESRFNAPILAALARWVFQPAQMRGEAVPLKVLIGIPLLPYD